MNAEPLIAPFAKTERAITQIEDIERAVKGFFETNPYRVRADLNPDRTEQVWRFVLTRKIPHTLNVMVGEALHNLRTPLDNVLSAIALQTHASASGVGFPIGRDENEFKTELGKQKKLPTDAKDIIAAAKPYRGGNDLLWALHQLNRNDKHRAKLVPLNMPAETRASIIRFERGLPLIIGCRTGKHLVNERRPTHLELAAKDANPPTALYDARPGHIVFGDASTPGDESLEFMTTTPGAKFYADFQPSLNVGFGDVGLDGQPVAAVLNDMRDLVQRLLLAFEGRFFR